MAKEETTLTTTETDPKSPGMKDKVMAAGAKTSEMATAAGAKTAEMATAAGAKTAEMATAAGAKTAEMAKAASAKSQEQLAKAGSAIKSVTPTMVGTDSQVLQTQFDAAYAYVQPALEHLPPKEAETKKGEDGTLFLSRADWMAITGAYQVATTGMVKGGKPWVFAGPTARAEYDAWKLTSEEMGDSGDQTEPAAKADFVKLVKPLEGYKAPKRPVIVVPQDLVTKVKAAPAATKAYASRSCSSDGKGRASCMPIDGFQWFPGKQVEAAPAVVTAK